MWEGEEILNFLFHDKKASDFHHFGVKNPGCWLGVRGVEVSELSVGPAGGPGSRGGARLAARLWGPAGWSSFLTVRWPDTRDHVPKVCFSLEKNVTNCVYILAPCKVFFVFFFFFLI